MKYELAKALKDAGFPQSGKGTWTYHPDNLVTRYSDRVYDPTLSELIDACGDQEFTLVREIISGVPGWQAIFRMCTTTSRPPLRTSCRRSGERRCVLIFPTKAKSPGS